VDVVMSNAAKWQGQITAPSSTSPPVREHCAWVQASSNAYAWPPSTVTAILLPSTVTAVRSPCAGAVKSAMRWVLTGRLLSGTEGSGGGSGPVGYSSSLLVSHPHSLHMTPPPSRGSARAVDARSARDLRWDLHAPLELLERGRPPPLAARILAPADDQEVLPG
jgi:hypothetical protein